MSKTIKRRRAWLTFGGLFVAGLVTIKWLSAHEPTLIEKAHVVAPMPPDKRVWDGQNWNWLSDTEILVVTSDRTANSHLESEADDIDWQGHVDLLNVITGDRRRLQGLTDLLNRKSVSPIEAPDDFQASPNGAWLIWMNHKTLDGWSFPAAAHLDGTHFREWDSNTRGNGFFLDDGHWIEQSARGTFETHVLDLADPKKDHNDLSSTPRAKAVFAHYADYHPIFVEVEDEPTPSGRLEIATYRTEDTVQAMFAERHEQPGPLPLQKGYVNLPRGAVLVRAEVSPQQQTIFYHLHIDYAHPLLAWLHRIFPKMPDTPTRTESLWVSKANGQGLHEIGQVVVQKGMLEEEPELSHVEWLPGGKQISFLYRHKLYVLPVATAKP